MSPQKELRTENRSGSSASHVPGASMPGFLARRRLDQQTQSGYVLGVVLAAMTVGLLLITALLSLSFTTFRAASVQQKIAREQRAADGGLETALTRIRAAADNENPCAPLDGPDPEVSRLAFQPDTPTEVDVRVECDKGIGNSLNPSSDTLELVGGKDADDDYASIPGGFDWTQWNWANALAPRTDDPATSLHPTLVHKADQRLIINGNVDVRKGAAPMLGSAGDVAAVDVSGTYSQGDLGFLGDPAQNASECGVLDQGAGLGLTDPTRAAIVDKDSTPDCDNDDKKVMEGTLVVDGPTGDPGTVPSTWACGSTVSIPPGDYVGAQIDALNSHFDGSCANTLFHFEHGNYWFGASGNGAAITFDDDTSAFVFGSLKGSGPTATCDPSSADGVRIVLSGRTTIDHRAGKVSICASKDQATGRRGQALVQSEITPGEITLSQPVSMTHGPPFYAWWCNCLIYPDDFKNVANVIATDGSEANAPVECFDSNTPCKVGFEIQKVTAEGDRPIRDLKVAWRSSELPRAHLALRKATVTITGGSKGSCASSQDVGRTPGFVTAVDLTADCAKYVNEPQSALDGAKMTVEFHYRGGWALYKLGIGEKIRLSLSGLRMVVNDHEVEATEATSPSGRWSDAQAVRAPGGSATPPPCTAQPLTVPQYGVQSSFCTGVTTADTDPNELVLSKFDLSDSGLDDNDQLNSLFLAIDNADTHPGDTAVANGLKTPGVLLGDTSVFVDVPGEPQPCEAATDETNTYTRSGGTYLIDLLSVCPALEQSASVLEGVTVTLSMSAEKGSWYSEVKPPEHMTLDPWLHPDAGLELPSLDYVRLVATTDSSQDLHRSRVTSDGTGTRFRVYGDVVMPRMSLDVAWNGPYVTEDGPDDGTEPDADTDPVFTGSVQLHSLGSLADADGSVGILCCGAGSTEAQIRAQIRDGSGAWVDRGVAHAVVDRKAPDEPLAGVVVTGWQLCGRGGCVLPAGGASGPPP